MPGTWFIDLEGRVSREDFDKVCSELGINFSSETVGGNTYYDMRHEAESAAKFGGVEIGFGGIRETQDNNAYATQITISSLLEKEGYKAMKKTSLDLSQRIPFKSIYGKWFDDVSSQPLPYKPDVYQIIE
ncbi:hypothetical protein HYU06_01285 [Candidatus Woesearchaeota archaeon]|nr:hypothetical protein [Candidatus Woesearchaeota archaeon]